MIGEFMLSPTVAVAIGIAVALLARMRVDGTTPTTYAQLNGFYGDSRCRNFLYQALQK